MDDQFNLGQEPARPDYILTSEIRDYLRETAKWATFISIMIFISAALMIVLGLSMSAFSGAFAELEELPGFSMVALSFIYILIGAIYIIPGYFLFQFGAGIKSAFKSYNEVALTDAFRKLKSNFKFVGLAIIISIVLYILMIIVIIGVAAFSF